MSPAATPAAVAIVGIGCRFPGGVCDVDGFWRLLSEGVDAITEIPASRIDLERYFDPRPATPGRMMTRRGGFLAHIDEFDAQFFGISPREAERLDPQQRLLLETAWEAFEDAGQDVERLDGSPTAVFVGQWLSDFEARLFADPQAVDFQMTTGSGRYASAGRLSYAFGLRGPSLTLDSACSSSLAAVHLAVRSLRAGECTLALAGGANVILQPHISIAYSQSRMMAPDGRCKFGDADGDGYVRSEGAAVVVLKTLAQALADGDRVYAVIRGSAVNNDGRSSGSMGTPSRVGQEELLRSAYRDAGVDPARVGYVEAHGTGTRAGDPVELDALGAVLGPARVPGRPAWVGSVKTNVGHTEGTAGLAGLIKAALALHHGRIPASLHCNTPTPAVDWARLPLAIARQPQPWPRGTEARIAGVSAFGIAGTNAHVVLEEAPPPPPDAAPAAPRASALLPLSARSPAALQALAGRYAESIARGEVALADACRGAATGRTALDHRAAFVAADAAAMADALRGFAAGDGPEPVPASAPRRIAFVVPGQGAQWLGMARELAAREPVFLAALQQCDAAARAHVDWSIVAQLQGTAEHRLDRIDVIQPVLVAIAIAYAALWRSLGIEPDAVVGHSMGEVGAAHVAGVIGLDEAMRIVCRRSALMRGTSGQGAMALVELPFDDVRQRLRDLGLAEAEVAAAVSNSPRASVVSGRPEAVQRVLDAFEADGVFCRAVKVDVASHSPQMDAPAAALHAELAGLRPQAGRHAVYSTVLGRRAEAHEFDAAYWARNLRQPVLFTQAVERLLDDGVTVFVELGPHPVLLPSVEQTAQARGIAATLVACGRREQPEQAAFLGALGALWAAGVAVDWARVLPAGRRVDLPLYPWQRERHWVRQADQRAGAGDAPAADAIAPAQQAWLQALRWVPRDAVPAPADAAAPWLVVAPDEAALQATCDALAAAGLAASACPRAALAERLAAGRHAGVLLLLADEPGVAHQPVAALQALAAAAPAAGARLWLATVGAQAVDGQARSRVAVHAGAAWGAGRVIADEHPDRWGGMVDLDPAATPAARARDLVQALRARDDEPQVAFRDGQRFVLRLQPLSDEPVEPAPPPWRAGPAYLVTGGLGDVGLQVAAGLVARGVRRLVLMGRNGLPPRAQWRDAALDARTARRVAAVLALEAAGASVHVLEADLASAADTERALRAYEAAAWPPIRGVVHAAGVLESALALQAGPDAFARVLAPKLDGALHLDRLLPQLDCFVMFSSIIAVLGVAGTAAYAAANAGLDALAADRRARGLPAQSLQWGAWEGLGMLGGDAGQRHMDGLRALGVQGFAADDGVRLLNALAGRQDATAALAVMAMDWPALRGAALALLRGEADGADEAGVPLAQRLAALAPPQRRAALEPVVRAAVGAVLKLAPSRIDPRKALGALGLGSLLAMELRNRLEAALGRPLSATLAWNYPTVEALVGFLADLDGAAPPAAPAGAAAAPAAPAAPALADLSALSDEEAASRLRRRR